MELCTPFRLFRIMNIRTRTDAPKLNPAVESREKPLLKRVLVVLVRVVEIMKVTTWHRAMETFIDLVVTPPLCMVTTV